MRKFATAVCISLLAACSSTTANERPAASADDHVTPAEAEARATAYDARPTPPDLERNEPITSHNSGSEAPGDLSNDKIDGQGSPDTTPRSGVEPVPIGDGRSAVVDADNTGKNRRDRNDATMTPMDQGNSQDDIGTTQRIRKAIMADDSLSMTAKNVKVITRNGSVTLRGPVNSEKERSTIEAKAKSVAGSDRVNSQLEIAK